METAVTQPVNKGSNNMMRDKTDDFESRVDRERAEGARYESPLKYPDGNPKTQFGITKPRATYTPPIPYLEYSLAHLQGALKYGPFNWRDDPVTMSTYLDAAESHIAKFRAGMNYASDTGIHELGHAMTCLSIVIDAQAYSTIKDDRWKPRDPEAHPWGNNPGKVLDDYIESNQARVKTIREKWTNFQERFKAGEIDKNGDPIKSKTFENLSFAEEMRKYPERAIGRRAKLIKGERTGYSGVIESVFQSDMWVIHLDKTTERFAYPHECFEIDHGH